MYVGKDVRRDQLTSVNVHRDYCPPQSQDSGRLSIERPDCLRNFLAWLQLVYPQVYYVSAGAPALWGGPKPRGRGQFAADAYKNPLMNVTASLIPFCDVRKSNFEAEK